MGAWMEKEGFIVPVVRSKTAYLPLSDMPNSQGIGTGHIFEMATRSKFVTLRSFAYIHLVMN